MVTTVQAAKLLGCSRRWIQKLQRRGRLHSIIDGSGVHHFARADVLAFAQANGRVGHANGSLVARVFAMFRERVDFPEIVIQTEQTPATIRALYDEYRRPLGVEALPTEADLDRSTRALDEYLASREQNGHAQPAMTVGRLRARSK